MEESGKVEKLKGDDATNEIDDEALNALLVALNGETNEALNEMETDANVEITASCVDLPDALWDCLGNVLDASASESKTRAQTAEDIVRCIEERGPPREVVMMATANVGRGSPSLPQAKARLQRVLAKACARVDPGASAKRTKKLLTDSLWVFERCFPASSVFNERVLALSTLVESLAQFFRREEMQHCTCVVAIRALGSCADAPPGNDFFHSDPARTVLDLLCQSGVAATLGDLHRILTEQQTKPPQDDEHDTCIGDEGIDFSRWDERGLACVALVIVVSEQETWVPAVWTVAERIRLIEPFAHHFLGIRASQFIAERGVQLANWGLSMGEKGCLADIRSDGVHEKALANLAVALANYASSHPVAERRADAVKCLIRAFDLVCGPAVPGSSGGLALLRSVYERCFFVPPKALAIDHVRRHVASTWNKDLCETVADFSVSQLEAFASGSSGDLEMHADLVISFLVLTRLLAARHHFADSDLCTRAVAASKNLARSITQAQSELYTVSAMDTSNTSAPHEGACKHSHQQCQHPHKNADAVQSNALVIEDAPFRPPPPPTRSIAQRGMHLALLEDANSLALAAMSQREN